MAEQSLELSITKEDLEKLAQVNPLAWAQLLHIRDNRVATERIQDLEAQLETAKNPNAKLVEGVLNAGKN